MEGVDVAGEVLCNKIFIEDEEIKKDLRSIFENGLEDNNNITKGIRKLGDKFSELAESIYIWADIVEMEDLLDK
ncbi:MAG: hypothetical protein SVR08_00080 [Spirochaetota bacterium]|nr:hypothetical protein [Spirochaetota bacterium]